MARQWPTRGSTWLKQPPVNKVSLSGPNPPCVLFPGSTSLVQVPLGEISSSRQCFWQETINTKAGNSPSGLWLGSNHLVMAPMVIKVSRYLSPPRLVVWCRCGWASGRRSARASARAGFSCRRRLLCVLVRLWSNSALDWQTFSSPRSLSHTGVWSYWTMTVLVALSWNRSG